MSENLRKYIKTVYALDAVVQRTPADAWDNQSPCEEWTAREVLGHTIWGMKRMTAIAQGTEHPAEQAEADVAGPNPVATWNGCRTALLAAVDTPGALQHEFDGPFGKMTLDAAMGIFFADPLLHAWDIATAVGLDPIIPADLAEVAHANLSAAGDSLRGPGMFGPEVKAPDGASAIEKFVAISGR